MYDPFTKLIIFYFMKRREAARHIGSRCACEDSSYCSGSFSQFSYWVFKTVRARGGLIGVAVDPLAAHECGNQRYMAIPWLDACLTARLPAKPGQPAQPG